MVNIMCVCVWLKQEFDFCSDLNGIRSQKGSFHIKIDVFINIFSFPIMSEAVHFSEKKRVPLWCKHQWAWELCHLCTVCRYGYLSLLCVKLKTLTKLCVMECFHMCITFFYISLVCHNEWSPHVLPFSFIRTDSRPSHNSNANIKVFQFFAVNFSREKIKKK